MMIEGGKSEWGKEGWRTIRKNRGGKRDEEMWNGREEGEREGGRNGGKRGAYERCEEQ